MCKPKTPKYTPPPKPKEYARERAPSNAGLADEARYRAALSSGGDTRSTILSSQQGVPTRPLLGGQGGERVGQDVVLGGEPTLVDASGNPVGSGTAIGGIPGGAPAIGSDARPGRPAPTASKKPKTNWYVEHMKGSAGHRK